MNPVRIRNITWLGTRTGNFDAMVTFIKDILRLKEVIIQEDMAEFRLEGGEIFEIFKDPSNYNPHFTNAPVAEFLVDNIEETQASMESKGIRFISSPKKAGKYSWTHFIAPDENIYGLATGDYRPLQEVFEENWQSFHISTDKTMLDTDLIFEFLKESYWASKRPKDIVLKSIENSMCFGVYETPESDGPLESTVNPKPQQIGFARVIIDFATFAYIADVFILEKYRGRGLSKWLMECIMKHPSLQGLRRWLLATKDAHGLYAHSGFTRLNHPERWMEKFDEAV